MLIVCNIVADCKNVGDAFVEGDEWNFVSFYVLGDFARVCISYRIFNIQFET